MGAKGRTRIEQEFSSEKMAAKTESLYRELTQPKIAFLLSQFPEMHETFILREFNGQKEKGMNFEIYSYKPCRDRIIHPEAEELIKMTVYANPVPLWSLLYIMARHPAGFLKALGYTLLSMLRRLHWPLDMIKVMVIFLRSLYFARIMEQHHITHIHSHWATMPTTGAQMIAKMTGISYSFTAHAWDIYLNDKTELKQKIKNAEFAVTCTRANKSYIESLDGGSLGQKVFVNYHGVNLAKFSLRDEPGVRREALILAIGRLVEQKGFEYLIKACGILKRRSIPFRCVIIGNGPLQAHFETLITNLGLKGYVELAGSVTQEDIRNYFRNADVFAAPCVISSDGDRDGIPNVLLEALSVGVPVVGTGVSGLPEVLVDGQTGVVVSARDERSLSRGLERVITRQVPVDQMVQNGRAKMEEDFDMYRNVEELIGIFEKHGLLTNDK